jgi:uncharacterized protein (DUF362 family)/Pyruvate/2-oxoacid:ferredoxin oxidoreductase delta subunit
MNKIVALERCDSYDSSKILDILLPMIEQTGFPEVQHKTVLLKPNILSGSAPSKAVTTHPEFLRAVIQLLKKKDAGEIWVGDSCAVGSSLQAAKKTGIAQVCREEQVDFVEFTETTLLKVPEGKFHKQFYPSKIALEADVIISLPKMKTNAMMYFTGAMKNLFGVFPGLAKAQFHFRLPEKDRFAAMIVDLNLALKPHYAIMDGIVAMEGAGPGNGDPYNSGLILASENLLALDICASNIMGYDGANLPIHKDALSRGIWLNQANEIENKGIEAPVLKDFKRIHVLKDTGMIRNILPKAVYRILTNLMVPKPHFIHKKCILCGKCVKICPPDALVIQGKNKKKVRIDYAKCIRCYCCDEVCPEKAIRISRL